MGKQAEPTTIDEYLDRVLERIRGGRLAQVQEIRQELQLHLEFLVNSAEAIGHSHGEAVRIAVAQFGPPERIADEMLRVSRTFQRQQVAMIFLRCVLKTLLVAAPAMLGVFLPSPNGMSFMTTGGNWLQICLLGCLIGSAKAGIEWTCQYLGISLERSNNDHNLSAILPWELVKKVWANCGYIAGPYRIQTLTWKACILQKVTWKNCIGTAFLFCGFLWAPTIFIQKVCLIFVVDGGVYDIFLSYLQASQFKRLAGR